MKKSWYYWMYKSALKNGFGSLVPDFPSFFPIDKKEFDSGIMGQTMHMLSKEELKKLKRMACYKK
ncbi:MAG TPA: hypothetical protein VI977_05040 [archaeon]|nr:hypothetical protein [archaeon]